MINAINTTLDCRPKGFDCVDVGNATDILFGSVLDYFMGISEPFNMIVTGKFIGKDYSFTLFSNFSL